MWNNYLRPELNRQTWMEAEEKLTGLVTIGWTADALENRSEYQFFVNYQTKFSSKAFVDE
jgi:hypothetical protein